MTRYLPIVAAAALVAAACFGKGGGNGPTPAPQASSSANTTPTSLPTSTPDPLTTPPASHLDARGWLERALGPTRFEPPCPPRLTAVGVACALGDANGDGLPELAYLVPVSIAGSQLPEPSAVFVRDSRSQELHEFSFDLTADSSIFGIAFFSLQDRNGDGLADLAYLQNICGVTGCRTRPVVQSWDGTAWRDIGPADSGITNIDEARWEGAGRASKLVLHGGKLPPNAPVEAGPTRAATTTYHLANGRFTVEKVDADAPEFLYHAVLDAEELFARDWLAAIPAYEALAKDTGLKDWQARPGQDDRRPSLRGLALFRIALATAALQRDPATLNAALDRVILESKEPLFVNVAQQFRKGYNERGGVIGGCAEVNLYLSRPVEGTDTRGYVTQLFNYGYANPPGSDWLQRICPL